MLSKKDIKWILSLKNKKYRYKHKAFVVEGPKLVNDMVLNGNVALKIFTTDRSLIEHSISEPEIIEIDGADLKKISFLTTPNRVLAVFEIPESKTEIKHKEGEWGIALDFIQDPGNLGTILRTMSWLGIEHIYCSTDSVDMYNPKVVQASMGAIGTLQVSYLNLANFLEEQSMSVYLTSMDGKDLREQNLKPGIIVLGNEGNGIRPELYKLSHEKISIPKLGKGESLNVAIATAIIGAWVKLK